MTITKTLLVFSCVFGMATSSFAQAPVRPEPPLSGAQRVHWALRSTIGPQSLVAGIFSSSWGTAFNVPKEYGTQWSGFAKRYGMRLTGVATSNFMEAGLGSLWNEDPRYEPSGQDKLLDHIKCAG